MIFKITPKLQVIFHFALLWVLANLSPLQRRQGSSSDVGSYIKSVKTALYIIDNIKAGNASTSCIDASLQSRLDSEGLDGTYAKQQLCETASGFDVVDVSDDTVSQLSIALDGLNSTQSDGSSQARDCASLSEDTLDNAGLDGAAIKSFICNISSSMSVAPSSTSSSPLSTISSSPQTRSNPSPTSDISTSDLIRSPTVLSTSSTAPIATSEILTSSTFVEPPFSISMSQTTTEGVSLSSTETTTIPTIVNSTNPNYTSLVTAVVTKTKWIDFPPLSFGFPTSNALNSTTTITVTSTSTIELTTTVIGSIPFTTPKESRLPSQGHRYGRPFPPYPYRPNRHRWPASSGAVPTITAPPSTSAAPEDDCTEYSYETTML